MLPDSHRADLVPHLALGLLAPQSRPQGLQREIARSQRTQGPWGLEAGDRQSQLCTTGSDAYQWVDWRGEEREGGVPSGALWGQPVDTGGLLPHPPHPASCCY